MPRVDFFKTCPLWFAAYIVFMLTVYFATPAMQISLEIGEHVCEYADLTDMIIQRARRIQELCSQRACTHILPELEHLIQELTQEFTAETQTAITAENQNALQTFNTNARAIFDALGKAKQALNPQATIPPFAHISDNLPIFATDEKAKKFYTLTQEKYPTAHAVAYRELPDTIRNETDVYVGNILMIQGSFGALLKDNPVAGKVWRMLTLGSVCIEHLSVGIDSARLNVAHFYLAEKQSKSDDENLGKYQINLMPRDQDLETCFVRLCQAINERSELKAAIYQFAVVCDAHIDEAQAINRSARTPRITICPLSGKENAQQVIDQLYQLFGDLAHHGCGFPPAYNAKVTDFLYFEQNGGEYTDKQRLGHYYEQPYRIYFRKPWGATTSPYHLENPALKKK